MPRLNVGPLLFCWTILSLCTLFWYLPPPQTHYEDKTVFQWNLSEYSDLDLLVGRRGGGGGSFWTDIIGPRFKLVKNKLRIPENHKNIPNVLNGFQVLYPSVIVIRYVMLCPLLWLGPLCCVRQTISHVTPRKVHCLPGSHSNTTETKKTWHLMQETR